MDLFCSLLFVRKSFSNLLSLPISGGRVSRKLFLRERVFTLEHLKSSLGNTVTSPTLKILSRYISTKLNEER